MVAGVTVSSPKPTKKTPITRLTTTICRPWLNSTTRPTFPHCRRGHRRRRRQGRRRRAGRPACRRRGRRRVAGAELGQGADLPRDPRHEEDDAHDHEQRHGDGQERAVEVGRHLPDLGREEQEGHEQQEEGQGPHQEAERRRPAGARTGPPPTGSWAPGRSWWRRRSARAATRLPMAVFSAVSHWPPAASGRAAGARTNRPSSVGPTRSRTGQQPAGGAGRWCRPTRRAGRRGRRRPRPR